MIENISGYDARIAWIDEANDRQPVFSKAEIMSVGMLELIKVFMCR